MSPWKFERALRTSLEWMRGKWINLYGKRVFGWTPWALTADNQGDNPKYPHKDAEKIFQELRDLDLLTYQPVPGVQQEGKQLFVLSLSDEPEMDKLIQDNGIWSLSVKPFFSWVFGHRYTAMVVAGIIFILGSFMAKLFENWADDFHRWLQLPTKEAEPNKPPDKAQTQQSEPKAVKSDQPLSPLIPPVNR